MPVEDRETESPAISVVICTHNPREDYLERVLGALCAQTLPKERWELLLIDNASREALAGKVNLSWHTKARHVPEDELGLNAARRRGISEASGSIIVFVDDDNLLAPNYLESVDCLMRDRVDVGAIGGAIVACPECNPPQWFRVFQYAYACGPQAERSGDITETRGFLYGAGLVVRTSACRAVFQAGFDFCGSDRRGNNLSSGGDTELCLALRLAGWRLYYEEQLQTVHLMPKDRLNWLYLRRLYRGFGRSDTVTMPYRLRLEPNKCRVKPTWLAAACQTAAELFLRPLAFARAVLQRGEGRFDVLRAELLIGRLCQLLSERSDYDTRCRKAASLQMTFDPRKRGRGVAVGEPLGTDQFLEPQMTK
jgi:GT2 family glycosyltransferase